MCGPWAIPIALSIAGPVMQYFGQRQAEKARESTFMAERMRQHRFTDEQMGHFQDSLAKAQDVTDPEAQARAAQSRENTLNSVTVPAGEGPTAFQPGSSSAPAIVGQARQQASQDSVAFSKGLAHALASLGGTDDQMQQFGIGLNRNNQHIGQIGGFMRDSMGVLNPEMEAASHKGSFLTGLGGLAQAVGSAWLGSKAGAGGGGKAPFGHHTTRRLAAAV